MIRSARTGAGNGDGPAVMMPAFRPGTASGAETREANPPSEAETMTDPGTSRQVDGTPDTATQKMKKFKIYGKRRALTPQQQATDNVLFALRNAPNVDVTGKGLGAGVIQGAVVARATSKADIQGAVDNGVVQGGVSVNPMSERTPKDRPSPANDTSRTGKMQRSASQSDLVQPTAGVSVGLTFWETALLAGGVILYFVLD